MSRLLSISLLAISLSVVFATRERRVSAQTLILPYYPGDTVRLEYADDKSRGVCVIDRYYGSFLSCKASPPPFGASDPAPRIVYNLDTVISIQLVKRAE